jgi:RimJ/RimL family protein N-acetyltransferase
MSRDSTGMMTTDWRRELPALTSRLVSLREPTPHDHGALVDLLSLTDASRFGLDDPITEERVRAFIEQAHRERSTGLAFTYIVTLGDASGVVGLARVRQLDPAFEAAEWEMTLTPSVRGTGAFLDAARLLGSFAFDAVGAYRLEARVLLQNGRANGALTKLGAVQEGVLRKSIRRGAHYFDQVLWSVLKDDWGAHWVSTATRVH